MIQMNPFAKRNSHRYREQTYGYQGGEKGNGINWEIGIGIYMLPHIK